MPALRISKTTRCRFILGKQGLYPGRRWRGKTGVGLALQAGCVVQIDPLTVVAHSHDIALYGRVLEYNPAYLSTLLYTDRYFFEAAGTVMLHPMEDLPYWRVVMARKQGELRRVQFATEHADVVEMVRRAIRDRGPLGARDFDLVEQSRAGLPKGSFRSGKAVNQALDYLWIAGEVMTHSRKGLERMCDLRERISPAYSDQVATDEEAEAFFALKTFQRGGMLSAQEWKTWFAGTILRSVSAAEASARLESLLSAEKIVPVMVQEDARAQHFILTQDLPLLEQLHAGQLPEEWQPLDTSTDEEMTFLAPLEIVSARGRARSLFDFEYLWEVYKPQEKRRWGYYTLPILYQERLVARADLKFERATSTLVLKGFWLENHAVVDEQFLIALARAFKRFMRFIHAEELDDTALSPREIQEGIPQVASSP